MNSPPICRSSLSPGPTGTRINSWRPGRSPSCSSPSASRRSRGRSAGRLTSGSDPHQIEIIRMARVLLVDDEESIRDVLCEALRGHACDAASSAEQALALLGENPYDVVVTDISLPGMSGVELFGHVMGRL